MEGKREGAPYVETHSQWSDMNIDHIKPKSNGGGNVMLNYQLTCYRCNSAKGDRFVQ